MHTTATPAKPVFLFQFGGLHHHPPAGDQTYNIINSEGNQKIRFEPRKRLVKLNEKIEKAIVKGFLKVKYFYCCRDAHRYTRILSPLSLKTA